MIEELLYQDVQTLLPDHYNNYRCRCLRCQDYLPHRDDVMQRGFPFAQGEHASYHLHVREPLLWFHIHHDGALN